MASHQKNRMSPRQKMINLMYVVLMAMLALNVSSDVLNGFSLVEDSLLRTTANASATNETLYKDLREQMEDNPAKVKEVADAYDVPDESCFTSAEEMISQPKLADVMFITTQDQQHVGQAIKAMEKGYDLLMEKPISPDLNECREIIRVAKKLNRTVVICHVLRYTPFYQEVKRILKSGKIGEVVSVMGIENVGYWHQAHSFVRGNWRNSNTTSPMILQKCCHDLDLLLWLTGKTCKSVTSFGNTYLFKEENAPEGAALRCTGTAVLRSGTPPPASPRPVRCRGWS